MLNFFNLCKLLDIPRLRQVGREGGTAVVNNSKNLKVSSSADTSSSTKYFKETKYPTKHTIIIKTIYLKESFLKSSSSSSGKITDDSICPLKVLKPVWDTMARILSFLSLICLWSTFVPENNTYLLLSFNLESNISSEFSREFFIIGILSPVNIDSFTTAEPLIKIESHGRVIPSSGTSNKSPGTNSNEDNFWTINLPSRFFL